MSGFLDVSGKREFVLPHDQRERSGFWIVPSAYRSPLRVLLAFHGAGSNANDMCMFSGLDELAQRHGIVVCFPNGTGRREGAYTWNGGPQCGYAGRHRVDDLGFMKRLIADTSSRLPGESITWLAAGMSNGGLFCLRLAERMSFTFPAVAAIAAAAAEGDVASPPEWPVSVLLMHGSEDSFVPYAGGVGRSSLTRTPFQSVPQTVAQWARWNQCRQLPCRESLPNRVEDGTRVEQLTYAGGKMGTAVQLYRILGGGHTWPGRTNQYEFLGRTTGNLVANDVIWEFFVTHARHI